MQGLNELSFKALRLFVAVLDYGSFSEVARREGLAPSFISRQVQLMEQALGQQLLYPIPVRSALPKPVACWAGMRD